MRILGGLSQAGGVFVDIGATAAASKSIIGGSQAIESHCWGKVGSSLRHPANSCSRSACGNVTQLVQPHVRDKLSMPI